MKHRPFLGATLAWWDAIVPIGIAANDHLFIDHMVVTWDFARGKSSDKATRRRFGSDDVGGTGASDPSAISYDGHTHQLKDFIRSIRTGSKPLIDAREGRRSVEIILAIYQSAWTGKTVSLPLKRDPTIPARFRRKK